MKRADRILDLQEQLRGKDTTSVKELAHELGVSTRTVRRDLALLRERGVPISTQAGPGGGVRLDRSRGVTAVHLAITEVAALWLGATLAAGASHLPWSGDANAGLRKLLASLPSDRAKELRSLARRVLVGPPASPAVRASAGTPPPELLGIVERAFTQHRAMRFAYVDRAGVESTRDAEPHGLLFQPPVWYLLARDLGRAAPRMFRADRMSRPRVLESMVFTPDPSVLDALAQPELAGCWTPLRLGPSRRRAGGSA